MRPLHALGLLAVLAAVPASAGPPQGAAPAGGVDASTWRDVELPEGLQLELATGEVTSRAVGGALTWSEGRLAAEPPLLALGSETGRYELGVGAPWEPDTPAVGDAFAFVLESGRWGIVRVLALGESALRLELAHAPEGAGGADALVRTPDAVRVASRDERLVVSWPAEPGARYAVERRVVNEAESERFEVDGGTWTDPRPPRTELFEYRVRRLDAPLGARARGHRIVTDEEGELGIERGMRVDLLAGELGGARVDLEVIYLNPPSIALRPMGGVTLEPIAPGSWTVPAPGPGRYVPDRVRTTDLGVDLAVRLPESIFARVSFRRDEEGAVHLRRSLALDGGLRFPEPPEAPSATWTGAGLRVEFPALAGAIEGPEHVVLVAERELELDGGEWRAVEESRPGSRTLFLEAGPRDARTTPLVRYRFRHRLVGGPASPCGAPVLFLRGDRGDPEQVATWLDGAFAGLTDDEFERRLEARRMIEALADAALPRLEAALVDEDPELSAAARELLGTLPGAAGRRIGLLLRAQAIRMGRTGAAAELPPGLESPDPVRRAWGLLAEWRDGARVDDGGATWLQVVERADPDATLVRFAELLGQLPAPDGALGGRPVVETPPAARATPAALDPELADELGPELLAQQLERAVDVQRPDEAWVLLALADRLARADAEVSALEDARLVLRMLARWRSSGDASLLAAARSVAADPTAELRAWRTLIDRRARSAPSPVERRIVRLEEASWAALVRELEELAESGETYVDLVLPAGEYAQGESQGAGVQGVGTLVVRIAGLRLVADGEVLLHGAIQVTDARDVILENLAIEHPGGTPLYTRQSEVHVRGGRIVAYQTAIMAQGGRVELEDVLVSVPDQASRSRWAARLSDGAELWARGCLFAAGTIATAPGSSLYLDGCVLSTGAQSAIQGQRGERVVVRDSLLIGDGTGISGVERGLLVGVLLDFARDAVAPGSTGIRLSPALVRVGARTPPLAAELFLPTCPLARTRR